MTFSGSNSNLSKPGLKLRSWLSHQISVSLPPAPLIDAGVACVHLNFSHLQSAAGSILSIPPGFLEINEGCVWASSYNTALVSNHMKKALFLNKHELCLLYQQGLFKIPNENSKSSGEGEGMLALPSKAKLGHFTKQNISPERTIWSVLSNIA